MCGSLEQPEVQRLGRRPGANWRLVQSEQSPPHAAADEVRDCSARKAGVAVLQYMLTAHAMSRILAIGDVHGCHDALETLLGRIVVSASDTLVFVGDAIDRGPSSKQVVDRILSLRDKCKLVFIMGNHEEMMRDAISGRGLLNAWLDAGGRATLDSYGGNIDNIPPDHIRFLVSASPFFETDSEIFVHANLEHGVSLPNQTSDFLRWKHLGGSERPYSRSKRVICGHTPQTDGIPLAIEGWVCIDTFPHGGKWLTCLDVQSDHILQASETGKTREFPLSKYS